MSFSMQVFTDGACRGNGTPAAVGGAGVWFPQYMPDGRAAHWAIPLPQDPHPTSNRAELTAIVHALCAAHDMQIRISRHYREPPPFGLTVHSDSQYAVNCMTVWIDKWRRNGWVAEGGGDVKNRDLIEEVQRLKFLIEESFSGGRVVFKWVKREENQMADGYANEGCNLAEEGKPGFLSYWIAFEEVAHTHTALARGY
ncbi:ribonuclease H-like domain-containing protein [Mycena vulgaris]|nr:ribonuclease H-like domain-containing protein [Mycena vulgaris]